ncbi:MAG: hypothetical protein J6S85_20870 [Methanobrevibacter sp.]|nr:hypothetical protein [Methanobrevibacter sp.]
MRDIHVAVAYDNNGSCCSIAKVKAIGKEEFNKLTNEAEEKKNCDIAKKYEVEKRINIHNDSIYKLEKKLFYVAKSIYDKFVDRGYIEDDVEFQNEFYEHIFNDKPIDEEKIPEELKQILRKIGE